MASCTDVTASLPGGGREVVRSLPGIVAEYARQQASRVVFSALDREGEIVSDLTAGQLDVRCRELAGQLRAFVSRGDRVLVPSMPGVSFQVAFLACLYAEVVAVPVPALRVGSLRHPDRRSGERLGRLLAVCADCRPIAIMVRAEQHQELAELAAHVPELSGLRFVSADPPRIPAPPVVVPEWVDPESLAFLQYTSGSTSAPRGVVISNGSMLANQRQIRDQFNVGPDWTLVNWLPAFHDMGLCAGLLQPLFNSARAVLLEPETFLLRPERWLAAISGVPDVGTAAPDFAYAFAAARVSADVRANLDLSGWRVALTGAEPVKPSTVRRFSATFASCGFSPSAFSPAYGLAESTLLVTSSHTSRTPTIRRFDRAALQDGRAVSAAHEDSQELVGVGHPPKDTDIRIVDPTTGVVLRPDAVGEIWVRSPSNGTGYWGQPESSAQTFQLSVPHAEPTSASGRWLRTGDLGFVDESQELFITGRLKEMIIIRGANYFPHDFEHIAQGAHPLLQTGLCAAFADRTHPERVVIVVETDRAAQREDMVAAAAQSLRAISARLPVQSEVLLIPSGLLPRTTSGKVRRLECATRHADGTLRVLCSSNDIV